MAEFKSSKIPIPREDKTDILVSLRDNGLSGRAISSATGVPQSTVVDTLRRAGDRSRSPALQSATQPLQGVTGIDGRVYERTRSNAQELQSRSRLAQQGKTITALSVESNLLRGRNELTAALHNFRKLDFTTYPKDFLEQHRKSISDIIALANLALSAFGGSIDVDWDSDLLRLGAQA